MLSESDKFRYLRHLMLDEVGESGQEKLFGASALIIGAGGLGSPNALYLTAAGIGKIGVLDFDKVDLSNLQRQILHNMGDLERFKVDSAFDKLSKINDRTEFTLHYEKIAEDNICDLIKPYQFIIDATDNFEAKFLINSACVRENKPFSHAGIYKFCGNAMSILPRKSACLACAFEAPPPKELNSFFKAGLFGAVPGVLGCIQASECIKYFLGTGEMLYNRLLSVDLKKMIFREVAVRRNENCQICGDKS